MSTATILGVEPGLFAAYVALLVLAVTPIYLGANQSVDLLSPPSPKDPKAKPTRRSDTSGLDKEVLSSSDAYWFPITGSAVLFGLYLLFNYLDKDHVNTLLTVYFALLGCYALASVFADAVAPIERFLGLDKYNLTLTHEPSDSEEQKPKSKSKLAIAQLYTVKFTRLSIVTFVVAALLTAGYVLTKHWLLNNLFAFALSITAIALMDLDSFKTGMTLLAGLFVYDVFWVFGTNVMVSVAKSFDAPVKMLFPKSAAQGIEALIKAKTGFTMLGLGDIVIPGIYVALSLRFDYHNHLATKAAPKQRVASGKAAAVLGAGLNDALTTSFSTPYFTTCFMAYVSGLVATVWVMHTYQAAQPALLYLSPACILSTLLTALVRGELGAMFSYSSDIDKELKDELVAGVATQKAAATNKKQKKPAAAAIAVSSSSSSSDEAESDEDQPIIQQDRKRARKLAPSAPITAAPAAAASAAPKKKPTAKPVASSTKDAAAALDAAAKEAERKRKRRDAERFDFEEQAAPPVTKRVHADGESAGGATDESELPSAPRSRASTREVPAATGNTSSDDQAAQAPSKKSKAAKAAAKKAAAAPSTAASALVSGVFTEAIAETGVGKSGLSGAGAKTKKSAQQHQRAASPHRARSKSPVSRDVFTTADLQASMAASLVDDEFMVVSRKGKKGGKGGNKAAGGRAEASPSPDVFEREASSSPAAKKEAKQDYSKFQLADPSDFGL